jgi:hypothetical protein
LPRNGFTERTPKKNQTDRASIQVIGPLANYTDRTSIHVPVGSARFPWQRVCIVVPLHSNRIRNPIFPKM